MGGYAGGLAAFMLMVTESPVLGAEEERACQRLEDRADIGFGRHEVPPGGATSWQQDGRIETAAGAYRLFAVWDGDAKLKSPPVSITID